MEDGGESDRRSDSERAERSRSSSSSESEDEERGSRASLGAGDAQAGSLNLYTTLGLSAEDVDALAQIPESEISIETLPHLIMQLKAKRAGRGSSPPPKADAHEPGGEEDEEDDGGRPRSPSKSPAHSQSADTGHGKHERRGPRHSKPPHERAHASSPPKFPLSYMEEDMREVLPRSFPHTCSLCHCTLYSVATWKDHLNGARHDDGRREFLRRSDSHAGGDDVLPVRRDSRSSAARRRPYNPGERPLPPLDRHHHHLKPKAGTKVVVTKFPRGSVGVEDLLNLAKPFGTVVKHLVFPCKGFLEFSTHEEAVDMVAHYVAKPAFVKDNRLALYLSPMVGSIHTPKLDKVEKRPKRLSHTSVVCFSHLPSGKEGEPEVLEVAKMFGEVRSSEVSNNEVLVEMEDWKDAEIMVKYYHTNPLKICGKNARVSMSSSHKRLRLSPDPSRRGDSSRGYGSWTKSKDPPRSSRPKTKEKAAPPPPKEPTGEEAEPGDGAEPRAAEEAEPRAAEEAEPGVGPDSAGEDEEGMKADEDEEEEEEESGAGAAPEGVDQDPEGPGEALAGPGEALAGPGDEPTPGGSPGAEAKDPMEESHESEGEDMDFPDNMDDFVTLDELDNDAGGNIESGESIQGGRVVTVRRIRKGYGLEVALLKLAEPFGRVTNHTISFYRQEEDMDFPDNMDDFVTLDELDNDAGGNIESGESIQGGRVVTVRRIRKGYGLEVALLKLAEPFGRVTNHTISFYRQEALIELESHEAADRMIQFYQGGKKALVFGRPVSVSMCLTLQKLEGPSGRSIYIGKLPLQKYSDISLLRLAQPFGKISAYHLNWRYRKCYIQMESVEAAQSMVQKYLRRPPKFYGSVIRICLCRKGDSQIPWKAPNKYQLWCVQRQKYQTPEDELELELEAEDDDEDEAENGQATDKPVAQKTLEEEEAQTAVSDSDQGSGAPASDRPSSREEKGELEKDVPPVPLGPYQPDNPVGMDYIVQRTGFFCKLCKVFYTNEKTAKSLHCSSLAHYQKLKKKLAEDDPGE